MSEKTNLIVILGPTASGKTSVAVQLAAEMGSEVISADSRQVFRGLDIGSGKDLSEYCVKGKKVPHHLIDILDPDKDFSVYHFQKEFFKIFDNLRDRIVVPVMAGGTGLYIDSVLEGYELHCSPEDGLLRARLNSKSDEELRDNLKQLRPELHNTTDLNDRERLVRAIEIAQNEKVSFKSEELPKIHPLVIGLKWPREILRKRIAIRLDSRLENGLIEEVEKLHAKGLSWDRLNYFGLEYRFLSQYLQGQLSRNDMKQKLYTAICKFAKRQETWFRRMERRGTYINWVENADIDRVKEIVINEIPK